MGDNEEDDEEEGKSEPEKRHEEDTFKEKKQYQIDGVIQDKEEKQYWKVTFLQTREM